MNSTPSKTGFLARVKNIRLLPPKDSRFYGLFNEMADIIVEASRDLVKIFNAPINERQEIEAAIHAKFVKCGRIHDQVEALMHAAHQPPFERPEIMDLTHNLMRIVKYIKHAANRYVLYNFPTSDKEMRELAPIINNACQEIAAALKELPRNRKIDSYFDTITRYEIKADSIYHQGLGRRFAEIRQNRLDCEKMIDDLCAPEARACEKADLLNINRSLVQYTRHVAIFFILREVYVELEKASDVCTDVATCLKRMVSGNV